jgi:hypothetical protein
VRFPWQRESDQPKATPEYWKPADRVALVWNFGYDGGPSTFHVEAPTAEEAESWARAASRTGKHSEVNAHLTPGAASVEDPIR